MSTQADDARGHEVGSTSYGDDTPNYEIKPFSGNRAALVQVDNDTYLDNSTGHYWRGSDFNNATDMGTTRPGSSVAAPAPPPVPGVAGPAPTPTAAPAVSAPAAPAAPVVAASDPAMQQKSDDLYDFLMGKAKQSQVVDPNDPRIRAQADNYSANLTRQGRRYLSELAERKGSGGNIGAESRMMNEKNAQAGAAHEGQLLQHESDQRRQEIEHALTTGAQFMTAQQQMSLQKELAVIDNNMKMYQTQLQDRQFGMGLAQSESQFGRGLAQSGSQFDRNLASQTDQFGRTLSNQQNQFGLDLDLRNRTLAQQAADAAAGRGQSAGQFGATMSAREREFNENLRQRAYEYDTDDEYRRSPYAG